MDEEAGVRAPVTRRRGRISVEVSDEGKASSAPGTPTKKRGGRKPAKTELELINENVVEENVKPTTKKTAVKEIKDAEEKPVTPSRRSARIKSNTSIVSDTVQSFDSPRAKRAARRTSQAGSDNEIPLTPIRQTRRTRRDSTSSIEKQDALTSDVKTSTKIPEPISEEPENITKNTNGELKTSDNENSKQSPIRRSPRLMNKNSATTTPEKDDKNIGLDDNTVNTSQSKKEESEDIKVSSTVGSENTIESNTNTATKELSQSDKLSTSSANLIKDLDINPSKKSHVNKSMSEAQETSKVKQKRQRTKSWTTITAPALTNNHFYSDNEKTTKKRQSNCYISLEKLDHPGSGDCKLNSSNSVDKRSDLGASETNNMNKSSTKKKTSLLHTPNKLASNNEASLDSGITNLFKSDPSNNIQAMVLMEDSDSSCKQANTLKDVNEDQCVPVVDHKLEEKSNDETDYPSTTNYENAKNESIFKHAKSFELKQPSSNDSCEPMDVDETLPEILTNNLSNKEMESKDKSISRETATNESLNKSPKKSSMRISTGETLDKSSNENKSTLILSQLKDSISENKSPQILSKSVNVSTVTAAATEINKTLSKTYLTSTPLQKKNVEKQDEQISNIFDHDVSKSKAKVTPKKNMSAITNSQSSEADSSADEESDASDKESLLDNEAEEASDNYLSGDSRDEEEKQYEKENEIVEKGETLTSEEEFSNDSDYEKDSFLVSSNEEDNELLSGSSDDLSMSDNELKMTTKSKQKYNERKLKQQKQASREMFQSRHKLNDSNKSSKSKLQSSDSSDPEDDVIGPRKNKRNRLISINESGTKSDSENSIQMENQQKSKKSFDRNALNEKEITICEETENTKEIHDPLATQIKIEPKTPIKSVNVSVGFVDTNNVKNTPCQENSSKSKNPLEDSDDSSLSSEDTDIAKNYDNVLKELKSRNTNVSLNVEEHFEQSKVKTHTKESIKAKNKSSQNINDLSLNLDMSKKESEKINKSNTKDDIALTEFENSNVGNLSLNLNKKSKKKGKQSIMDQLNLTQVKDKSTKTTTKFKENHIADDSSDSIDLKLLFSEDSMDSNKYKERSTDEKPEEFIPLKKSEAKTNIRENEDIDDQEEEMPFFIDTVGDSSMREDNNVKIQKSDASSTVESNDDGPPLEISYKKRNSLLNSVKEKDYSSESSELVNTSKNLNASNIIESEKKNKRKSLNKSNLTETQLTESTEAVNQSLVSKTPKSETKKKNISLLESHNKSIPTDTQSIDEEDNINQLFVSKTPKSDKKKKKNNSISETKNDALIETKLTDTEDTSRSLISKTPKSEKKQKLSETPFTEGAVNNSLPSKTSKRDKNKSILSESLHMSILTEIVNDSDEENDKSVTIKTPKSAKKNKNKSHTDEPEIIDIAEVKLLTSQTPKGKKKKNLSQSLNNSILTSIEIDTEDISEETTNVSGGKKNKHSKSLHSSMMEENITHQLGNSKNKSPKTKRHIETADDEQKVETENIPKKNNIITVEGQDNEGIKKRKRKHSGTPALEVVLTGEATNESIPRQSKKLRVSQNSEESAKTGTEETEELGSNKLSQNITVSSKKKVKKITEAEGSRSQNKNEKNLLTEIHFAGQNENKENGNENVHDENSQASVSANIKNKASKSKKRKHREDDDGRHKDAKVLKENSLDQIHIPRLPPSVLNNLTDKPKMKAAMKKHKAISTTEFQVEPAKTRRNKPSNYLEESVYLQDEDCGTSKKQKRAIKKPKVLPFVPTAAISNSGFTTNFKVNVIPQDIKFVAQSNDASNFKNDYLNRNKQYRSQTSFKKNRNIKMSKF